MELNDRAAELVGYSTAVHINYYVSYLLTYMQIAGREDVLEDADGFT